MVCLFFLFFVRDWHLNHKFGEFAITKRLGTIIHSAKKGVNDTKKNKK